MLPPSRSTLFPYTTLFRSCVGGNPTKMRQEIQRRPLAGQNRRRVSSHLDQLRTGLDKRPVRMQADDFDRSEEHTSELQSRGHLVCRLLLENKKNNYTYRTR